MKEEKARPRKKKERKLFPFLFRCDLVAATIIHTRYLLAVLSPCFVRAQSVRRTPLRGSRQRTVVYIIDIQMPFLICRHQTRKFLLFVRCAPLRFWWMARPFFHSLTTMNSHIYERPAFPRPSAWRPGQYKKNPTPSAVEWKHQVGNKIQDKWRWCWRRRWFFCKKGKKSHFGAAAGRYSWAPKSTSSKRQRRNELFEKSVVLEGGRDGGKTKIENRDHPISGGIFPFLYLSLSNFSFACRKFLPYTYQCVQVSASFYRIRNRMKRNGRSRSSVEEKVRARRKRDTVCVRGERRLFKNKKIPE